MADFNIDELPDDALISVPKGQLTAIGDAIRAKRDTAAPIEIPDMPMEIGLIEGGGGGGGLELIYDTTLEVDYTDTANIATLLSIPTPSPEYTAMICVVQRVGEPVPNAFWRSIAIKHHPVADNRVLSASTSCYINAKNAVSAAANYGVWPYMSAGWDGRIDIYCRANTTFAVSGTYSVKVYGINF